MQLEATYTGVVVEERVHDPLSIVIAQRHELMQAQRESDYQKATIRTLWTVNFALVLIAFALAFAAIR